MYSSMLIIRLGFSETKAIFIVFKRAMSPKTIIKQITNTFSKVVLLSAHHARVIPTVRISTLFCSLTLGYIEAAVKKSPANASQLFLIHHPQPTILNLSLNK